MPEGLTVPASKTRLHERPLATDYFQSIAYWVLGVFLLVQLAIIIELR